MRLLPSVLLGLTVLAELASVVLSWGLEPRVDTVLYVVRALVLAGVGALIVRRHPRHVIGWLFLGSATFTGVVADAGQGYGLRAAAAGWPGGPVAEWWVTTNWLLDGMVWILVLVLFPDGRLSDPQWRWVPVAGAVGLVLALPGWTLSPERDGEFAGGRNPLVVPWLPHGLLVAVGVTLFLAAFVCSVLALLVRLRRARGIERQQLRWFASAAALAGVGLPLSVVLWYVTPAAAVLAAVVLTGLPIAAGVAILRYRLYELDTVIDRTVVYAAVTVLLAGAYALTTLLLGTTLGGGSGWTTAAATLVVAVAFRPLRELVQTEVDRRFRRRRHHAVRRTTDFLDDLRVGRVAPEQVEELFREITNDPGLRLLVHLPDSGLVGLDGAPAPELDGDRGPDGGTTAIERGGVPIGVVVHQVSPGLLRPVLDAGGLAIEIARLHVELRHRLDEVRASRERIVHAATEERRRLERDLHDGAQQRLVTIGLALRHAQHEMGDAPAAATLDEAVDELRIAIDELRELARGLPPAHLDEGLAPAFRDLARRAPVRVAVDVSPARFGRGIEGAAYFVGCEGLTNAVKHARASTIRLAAGPCDGRLVVTVADDGVGGARAAEGSGLAGLADRVAALGGELRIESRPGHGTRLVAELPCGS
jgi:signal transduction histidine kinase